MSQPWHMVQRRWKQTPFCLTATVCATAMATWAAGPVSGVVCTASEQELASSIAMMPLLMLLMLLMLLLLMMVMETDLSDADFSLL
jgi:hypothetical protein